LDGIFSLFYFNRMIGNAYRNAAARRHLIARSRATGAPRPAERLSFGGDKSSQMR
jgi:hypothetical protein